MKKLLTFAFAAIFGLSLFAADIFTYAPLKGAIKSYTKTEYSIASKFGNYFRTPSVKYLHTFNDKNQEINIYKILVDLTHFSQFLHALICFCLCTQVHVILP